MGLKSSFYDNTVGRGEEEDWSGQGALYEAIQGALAEAIQAVPQPFRC